jgi:hypothetical protein
LRHETSHQTRHNFKDCPHLYPGRKPAYYFRAGDTASTAITLASGTAGTWSSGGLSAVDATNMPGLYELGLPNAALSGSGESVIVYLKGAANMVPCLLEIELTSVDVQDGNAFGMAYLNESVSSISSSGFSTLTYGNFK